jgi:hypothetical protein
MPISEYARPRDRTCWLQGRPRPGGRFKASTPADAVMPAFCHARHDGSCSRSQTWMTGSGPDPKKCPSVEPLICLCFNSGLGGRGRGPDNFYRANHIGIAGALDGLASSVHGMARRTRAADLSSGVFTATKPIQARLMLPRLCPSGLLKQATRIPNVELNSGRGRPPLQNPDASLHGNQRIAK